jgi:hypothetical protein
VNAAGYQPAGERGHVERAMPAASTAHNSLRCGQPSPLLHRSPERPDGAIRTRCRQGQGRGALPHHPPRSRLWLGHTVVQHYLVPGLH